jgi:glycosyltransferase involved in cell wall biosynthesis
VPKRFAIVSPNYYPMTCGVGDHSMRVAAELRRRGHDAVVFTRAPAEPNPEAPEVSAFGAPGRWAIGIARAVARRISDGGFDQVIIQYTPQMWDASRFGSPALPLLAHLLQRRGLPIAIVIHEAYTPWGARPDLLAGAAFFRGQFAMTVRASRHQFVTTESRVPIVARACAAVGAPAPRVLRVGPNAVPAPPAWSPGGHRIGLFSTLAVGKRFEVVIDAFDEIARALPDAELVLIGDLGPPTAAATRRLAAQIARSPSAGRIRSTGKLPLAEIARIIASLNVYLFPMNTGANTRSGTLPIALGTGIPVVATRGPETDSLFADGDNILFADDLDGASFATAALRILRDQALADRLSAGARRLYGEHLSWPRIVDNLLGALD